MTISTATDFILVLDSHTFISYIEFLPHPHS